MATLQMRKDQTQWVGVSWAQKGCKPPDMSPGFKNRAGASEEQTGEGIQSAQLFGRTPFWSLL